MHHACFTIAHVTACRPSIGARPWHHLISGSPEGSSSLVYHYIIMAEDKPKTVLVIGAPGAEEIELVAVMDILTRAGANVTLASTAQDTTTFVAANKTVLQAHTTLDIVLDAAKSGAYDLLYLPGGEGSAMTCKDDARIQDILEAQLKADDLFVGIICASPLALLPRQLCKDRTITCYPACADAFSGKCKAYLEEDVVVDGNLITSRGPGTAVTMALKLAELVISKEKRDEVAKFILYE